MTRWQRVTSFSTASGRASGPKHVLNGVKLSVPKGHSLVVIGGSGTGKSVMLKCILGILQPDGGSIRVGGRRSGGAQGQGAR